MLCLLSPLMQFCCFNLNVIHLYVLAKITFVCFPSAVSRYKPIFNLLFTTSPKFLGDFFGAFQTLSSSHSIFVFHIISLKYLTF